jgi:hypothetical protein
LASAQPYTIAELPPLADDTYCGAYALNESGQAAGYSGSRAVIWTQGLPANIQSIAAEFSVTYALNDFGQAAGDFFPTVSNSGAFFSQGTTMQPIIPPAGEYISEAYAMNNSGVVVGLGGVASAGYRWQAGTFNSFSFLPGDYEARPVAINNLGSSAGASIGPNGRRPVYWLFTTPTLIPLPAGNIGQGDAWGINDRGDVVGTYSTSNGTRSFIWNASSGTQALPIPPGAQNVYASALNNAGVVVGNADTRAVIWLKNSTGNFEIADLLPLVTNGSGWDRLNLYAVNEAGQIAGEGRHNGAWRGFIISPGALAEPKISTSFVNRDDPFSRWSSNVPLAEAEPVYAGQNTGDLVAWRVENAPPGASFKWSAVQTAGLTHQTIQGPEGVDVTSWSLLDAKLDWPPGTYELRCVITPPAAPAITLTSTQVVGWRTADYLVVGQIKPVNDYELSLARQLILKSALVSSYLAPKESFISAASKLLLLGLPLDINAKIWTGFQFANYGDVTGLKTPAHTPLRPANIEDKYWMVQGLLNDFPDLVSLDNLVAGEDLDNLLSERSYRMYIQGQLRYRLSTGGKIDVDSIKLLDGGWDVGPTKFQQAPQKLRQFSVSARGVEWDLEGNSEQSFITSETAPASGRLVINSANDSVSYYVAGRVGLEGRVPNYALFQRDAPYIFANIITALGPDGRDSDSRINLSVDSSWKAGTVTGTSHFNDIRIYVRDYGDERRRFALAPGGHLSIDDQLAAFLNSGSSTWPGPPPPVDTH